jgi:hypothetical protein
MSDCCSSKACHLDALRRRQTSTLKIVLLINAAMFLAEFVAVPQGILVRVTFDAEAENPVEMQRQGWQAILDNFVRHVESHR